MVDWAAAATAGATAIATAAGTGLWENVHAGFRGWLSKLGDTKAEKALQRLDATVIEIESAPEDQMVRDKVKVAWQTRFEDFLEELDGDERDALAQELLELARRAEEEQARSGAVSGDHGMAVRGDVNITAQDQGIAVAHNVGGINFGNPPRPGQE
ncbi:hypothetical protein KIK06_24685 [Nocardiopsis sp. EMB25]|uniref:hypothetical protein n=1 Tax=Nocardiopsis sp. EMB25 TaxID=2835867 RepID=UPI002284F6A0|nr:hypothetical protein [Nocardiopsis sp. EMB25]MCY9787086.1 hypothetical protein [Nocardiopsis sp. EMB25]